jgi:crotonobetainyl-CoA:carnitine CoA-transferase CaiB-like acyl-CoA transferase
VTGYGQTGPKKSDPAIDGVIQAVSGMMSITGTPQSGPLKTGSTIVDYTTGYAAALGLAVALFQRTRTGKGQVIDVSMLETAMTMMGGEVLRAITANETPPLVGNASGKGAWVSDTYPCKEGHLSIAASGASRREKLWKVIDGAEMPADARFASDAAVANHMQALNDAITRKLATKTAEEWEILMNQAGVPAMAVQPLARAVHHPQLKHREFFHPFDDSAATGLPPFAVPTSPYRLSASPATIHAMPPRLGQHTDEILAEHGYTQGEIAQLRANSIV